MPAPARAAPILARYAAPVKPCDPASTTTVPNVPLCPSRGRAGRRNPSPNRLWASAMRGIAATSTPTRGVTRLLYGDAFRQVPWLVDVAATLAGHEVREELQGHHVRNRREELGDRRDLDPVELHLGEGVVALADQGDYRRIASDHFLDVADHPLDRTRLQPARYYRAIAIQQ